MQRRTHWIRLNAASRIPRRICVLDTESRRVTTTASEQHTFRLGVASFDTLDATGIPYGGTWWAQSTESADLWWWIASKCSNQHKLVVYMHNASFDVRISRALTHLPELGFKCKQMALNNYGFWARLARGDQTIWLCDSLSFLPASLNRIAGVMQADKPPLPRDDAPDDEWYSRCRSDVEITREAMLRVIRYINDEQLGDFRMTGAAQGSAAFRHRFLQPKTLLVHDNMEALEAERESAFTGRAEVWKHGAVTGPLYEYDYTYAYAQLAYDHAVPTRFVAAHSPLPLKRLRKVQEKYAVLAHCDVETDMPVVPCRNNGHIVWPVGNFTTTLWDIEMRLLESVGATCKINRMWLYRRDHILRPWAEWIIGRLNLPHSQLDPVARIMLKEWSRSLIGRFGLRYPMLEEIGSRPQSDLRRFGVTYADGSPQEWWLQIGNQLFQQTDKVESPDSAPMVMSYIMAASRVRLWGLMCAAGASNIVYVDTDGAIVTRSGAKRLDEHIANGDLRGLRRKYEWPGGVFRAPRNIDLGQERRVSGAPKRSERLAPSVYRGEVWESLPAALARLHRDSVFVHERTFTVSDVDPRRVHLPDGSTCPIELPQPDQAEAQAAA